MGIRESGGPSVTIPPNALQPTNPTALVGTSISMDVPAKYTQTVSAASTAYSLSTYERGVEVELAITISGSSVTSITFDGGGSAPTLKTFGEFDYTAGAVNYVTLVVYNDGAGSEEVQVIVAQTGAAAATGGGEPVLGSVYQSGSTTAAVNTPVGGGQLSLTGATTSAVATSRTLSGSSVSDGMSATVTQTGTTATGVIIPLPGNSRRAGQVFDFDFVISDVSGEVFPGTAFKGGLVVTYSTWRGTLLSTTEGVWFGQAGSSAAFQGICYDGATHSTVDILAAGSGLTTGVKYRCRIDLRDSTKAVFTLTNLDTGTVLASGKELTTNLPDIDTAGMDAGISSKHNTTGNTRVRWYHGPFVREVTA